MEKEEHRNMYQQISTGRFYAVRYEEEKHPERYTEYRDTRVVLEAYGPLPEEFVLSADRFERWDYPQELHTPGGTLGSLADFARFPNPHIYKNYWYKKGWKVGRKYGKRHHNATNLAVTEDAGMAGAAATAQLGKTTWEGCYNEYVAGFVFGFSLETGRYIP